jgi:hypothetical protein
MPLPDARVGQNGAATPPQLRCDGCQLPATDEHITRRLLRLQMASRFRPLRIELLFLAEAPPPRIEDYFYWVSEGEAVVRHGSPQEVRRRLSGVLFDELMGALGLRAAGAGKPGGGAPAEDPCGPSGEACLGEFQKRGYFLADCLECPVEEIVPGVREGTARANPFELAHRYGPSIAGRVKNSYQARRVVLLSARTRHLIPVFEAAGLGDALLLHRGLPLHFPHPRNPAAQAAFREGVRDILSRL